MGGYTLGSVVYDCVSHMLLWYHIVPSNQSGVTHPTDAAAAAAARRRRGTDVAAHALEPPLRLLLLLAHCAFCQE